MPLYRWSAGAIAQMECSRSKSGTWHVVIRPREGADAEKLSALNTLLNEKKIAHFIGTDGGSDTLIIPDIAQEKTLRDLMSAGGWTLGAPSVIASREDKTTKGIAQSIKEQPLLMSSLFYNLNNLTWIVSGIQRARHSANGRFSKSDISEMMVGVMFSLGDLLLVGYGKDKSTHPVVTFSDALNKHLKAQGVALPDTQHITPEALQQHGVFAAADNFIRKHVVQIKALTKTAGSAFEMHAAMGKGHFNSGKFASGTLLGLGWLTNLFLDKPRDLPFSFKSEHEDTKQHDGLTHWIKEHPRDFTGRMAMGSNIIKGVGAIVESNTFKRDVENARNALTSASHSDAALHDLKLAETRQYDYAWNLVSAATMLIGNFIFSKSSKASATQDEHADQFQKEILSAAANTLMNIPPAIRDHSIHETARYIASIEGIAQSEAEVAATLTAYIEHLQHSAFIDSCGTRRMD